jgi:cell division protein FtsI/penicillin-binding protein 2
MLQQGMQLAVRLGTAKQLDVENRMRIAAKTGTTPHGKTFQSWITGYFPYDKPRHAFVLRSSVGTSQDQAVPLAHKFLFATQWPE